MRQFILNVAEIATFGGQFHVRCAGGPDLPFAPGQFYLARTEIAAQPFLRVPLYPFPTQSGGPEFFIDPDHPYAALAPGDTLNLLGPCGRGFNLPPRAAHLLLVAASPARLFSLLSAALEHRFAVTLLLPPDAPLPDLPPHVEIHRGPLTADLAAWADVIALDVPDPAAWVREIRALRLGPPTGFIQALITPTLPCGVGACQACWVETDHAYARKLACVDGPVFQL